MQTTVGRLIVERECHEYGMVHAFFISLSQTSDATDLRNQYRDELRLPDEIVFKSFSRNKIIEELNINETNNNVKLIKLILESTIIPPNSVLHFDEECVPNLKITKHCLQ